MPSVNSIHASLPMLDGQYSSDGRKNSGERVAAVVALGEGDPERPVEAEQAPEAEPAEDEEAAELGRPGDDVDDAGDEPDELGADQLGHLLVRRPGPRCRPRTPRPAGCPEPW